MPAAVVVAYAARRRALEQGRGRAAGAARRRPHHRTRRDGRHRRRIGLRQDDARAARCSASSRPVAGQRSCSTGTEITDLGEAAMRPLRRRMQMIFQDPMSSLNPRRTIGRTLTAPLLLHGTCAHDRPRRGAASRRLWSASACRQACSRATRMSCPAASASASASRARSCWSPTSCWPTRSSPASTSRPRRRC